MSEHLAPAVKRRYMEIRGTRMNEGTNRLLPCLPKRQGTQQQFLISVPFGRCCTGFLNRNVLPLRPVSSIGLTRMTL